jgi:hypothetical protein
MHPTRSNTAHRPPREAIATTRQPLDATPESRLQTTPPRRRPTHDDASASAESVRVTDVAAHGHGRAYLVERGLEQDGYSALKSLVADYLEPKTSDLGGAWSVHGPGSIRRGLSTSWGALREL